MSPTEKYISSSKKYDWMTPDDWFDFLDFVFSFTLDVAALPWNAKCEDYFTPEDDGLIQSWRTKKRWFLNPPWGKQYKEDTGLTIEDWISKANHEYLLGNEGILLVPENPTTGWYSRNIKTIPYTYEPEGRIRFIDPNRKKASQPTKGTLIWVFIKKLEPWQIETLNSRGRLAVTVLP